MYLRDGMNTDKEAIIIPHSKLFLNISLTCEVFIYLISSNLQDVYFHVFTF